MSTEFAEKFAALAVDAVAAARVSMRDGHTISAEASLTAAAGYIARSRRELEALR